MLYRLHDAGFSAYLVGGCVRDLLLGQHPKDFDVATNARPEEVRKLFRNCRLIGKRFRLAHIVFGRDIIEVATFRSEHHEKHGTIKGMIFRDNAYGTIEDDVWRRDFTINALYYNIADFTVVDYVNGIADIHTKTLRMIGDVSKRYHEDPVRILRAVRIAGKLNLTIDAETEKYIVELKHLLQHVSPSRLFLEILKLFQSGSLINTFNLLHKYDLFSLLFPLSAEALKNNDAKSLLDLALKNTEQRIKEQKSISPAFLFAVLLWHPIQHEATQLQNSLPPYIAFEKGMRHVLHTQIKILSIPKTISQTIRDICFLQLRFHQRSGSRPMRLVKHPRFRAAYDLLTLRAESGEPLKELVSWWKNLYDNNEMPIIEPPKNNRYHPRKRRRHTRSEQKHY